MSGTSETQAIIDAAVTGAVAEVKAETVAMEQAGQAVRMEEIEARLAAIRDELMALWNSRPAGYDDSELRRQIAELEARLAAMEEEVEEVEDEAVAAGMAAEAVVLDAAPVVEVKEEKEENKPEPRKRKRRFLS